MQLDIAEYEIVEPMEIPLPSGGIWEPSGTLGLFNHFSGETEFYFRREWPGKVSLSEFIDELVMACGKLHNDEARLEEAIKRTACIHEIRHCHDCFCTPIGVELFEDFVFAYVTFQTLMTEQMLSVSKGVAENHFPQPNPCDPSGRQGIARRFLSQAESLLQRLYLNLGPQPLIQIPGSDFEHDFYVVSFQDRQRHRYRLPCVSQNIVIDDKHLIVLWPLGFKLVVECLAFLQQEWYIKAVDESLGAQFRTVLRSQPNPYLPMLTTFTRLFSKRGEHKADEAIIHECLIRSLFVTTRGMQNGSDIGVIGWELMRLIEQYLDIEKVGVSWSPPPIDRSKWIRKPITLKFPLSLIEHVSREYLNPTLRIAEVNGVSFFSRDGYIAYFSQFPTVPLVFTSEGEVSVNDREFFELWGSWQLYRTIVHSGAFGGAYVCPARHPQARPFYERYGILPSGPICTSNLSSFACGVWLPDTRYTGTRCAWTDGLINLMPSAEARLIC